MYMQRSYCNTEVCGEQKHPRQCRSNKNGSCINNDETKGIRYTIPYRVLSVLSLLFSGGAGQTLLTTAHAAAADCSSPKKQTNGSLTTWPQLLSHRCPMRKKGRVSIRCYAQHQELLKRRTRLNAPALCLLPLRLHTQQYIAT